MVKRMSDLITINTNGLEEAIRCAICENPIKSERGCDGSCRYDEKLLNRIIEAVNGCEAERPHGEWVLDKEFSFFFNMYECSKCRFNGSKRWHFCPNCGASMQANDRQVTGKLNSEIEAKVKELEDAITRCERAEKEFASRTCKFRSPRNCDFCAFHSDCDEHWKEGETE